MRRCEVAVRCCVDATDWSEDGGGSGNSSRRSSHDQRRRRVSSAGELIQAPDYEFGLLRGGVAHHQLSTSDDPLHRAAWARLSAFWPSAFVDRLPEGLDRVRRHRRFAMIVDSPTAEYVATRRPCDLYATEPFLDAAAYGFAIGRHVSGADDLRTAIDRQLVRLRHDSVLQTLYLHWWRSECNSVERSPVGGRRRSRVQSDQVATQRVRQTASSRHHADSDGGAAPQRKYTALSTVVAISAYLCCTAL